jgi:ElaB/YqjD/DUF883 family membrane-anchored ribosome-binding protein
MAQRSVLQVPVTDPERELPADTRAVNPRWNQTAAQIGSTVGWAVANLRQMPQRAEHVKQELTNEIRDRLEAIAIREQGPSVTTRLREKAEQTADELKGRARENVQVARNRAERLRRENPLEIIVAAFSAAFILGVALRIWRSNRVY